MYTNLEEFNKMCEGVEIYGYIYVWENLWNNRKYVGQTKKLTECYQQHISNYQNQIIDKAIEKWTKENFDVYIVDACTSKEELNEREKYWIKYYNTFEGTGYNLTVGGEGGNSKYWEGKKRPEHSEKMKGKKLSEEHKKKIAEARKGKSSGMKGKKQSKESRAKISKSHKMSELSKKATQKRMKKIVAYDYDTKEYVGIFNSIKEASLKLHINNGNLCSNLTKNNKFVSTSRGITPKRRYFFEYV